MNILTNTDLLTFHEFVNFLDGNGSSRFVSILYRSKGTKELARHTVLLNVNRNRCLKVDLNNLLTARPGMVGLEATAADELITSLQDSIAGYNPLYTKHGYYSKQGNGNAQVSVKSVAYIRGYSVRKDVIEPGTHKVVAKGRLTVAKDNIRKSFKSNRCREFIITPQNFKMARHDGKTLMVDASGVSDTKLTDLPPVAVNQPVAVSA